MTATVAPSPWPVPSAAQRAVWRFGRVLEGSSSAGMQWVMRRNCSITPRQLVAVYLSLCVVSLVISAGFWVVGAPAVLAFAGLELVREIDGPERFLTLADVLGRRFPLCG